MKNIFKVIVSVILAYIATTIVQNFVVSPVQINLSVSTQIILWYISGLIIFIVLLSLIWSFLLRDKNIGATVFSQIKLKKIYFIIIAIFTLFSVVMLVNSISQYNKSFSLDDASHFVGETIYENTKYHFRFVYPKGSLFAYAHQEFGFVTRFFIPDGESIGNDKENVGIYIKEKSGDLETEVKQIMDRYSKNGQVDVKEVQFGGQKGYRMILTSDYSIQKGTKELFYITVKNNMSYELNYFPVAKNISIVDAVASSFEFTQ